MARLVLTQPLPRVLRLARALESRGHEVLALPFARIRPLPLQGLDALLSGYDWVVAVSPASVEALGDALGGRWPEGPGLALIGPGSQRSVLESGLSVTPTRLRVSLEPPFDAQGLIRLAPFDRPQGLRILVARGEDGREDWIDTLRARGADVGLLPLYARDAHQPDPDVRERLAAWLRSDQDVFCLLTQASSVGHLLELQESGGLVGADRVGRALVIHPRIAEAARAAGFSRVDLIEPGAMSIAAALESQSHLPKV